MSALVLNNIPQVLLVEEDDWESCEIPVLALPTPTSTPIAVPTPAVEVPTAAPVVPVETRIPVKNTYGMYPYFLAGVEGTVQKELFPRADFPLGNLKNALTTQTGINNYVDVVRNHIKSMFYVLKSTKYYNPVTKSRIPPKKKEYVDPNFQHVALNDQLKIYKLFGFQGHIGSKKDDEDAKREELLEKLKFILYDTNTLIIFVELLLQRIYVTVNQTDIRKACDSVKTRSNYDNKSYGLSQYWYHNASWQKLRYVYGGGSLDMIGGSGDGAIPIEMQSSILKTTTFQK